MFDHFYAHYQKHRKQFVPLYQLIPRSYIVLFLLLLTALIAATLYTVYRFNWYSSTCIILCIISIVLIDLRTEQLIKKTLALEYEQDKQFVASYLQAHHITTYAQITLFAKNLELKSNTTAKKLNLIPYIAALVSIFIYIADDADEIEPIIIWVSIVLILIDPLYNFIYNIFFDRKYKRFYELARQVEEVYIEGRLQHTDEKKR